MISLPRLWVGRLHTDQLSFMEGARLRSSVALPRVAAKPTVVEDNGEKLTIKTGQAVICNLVSEEFIPWMLTLLAPITNNVLGFCMHGYLRLSGTRNGQA